MSYTIQQLGDTLDHDHYLEFVELFNQDQQLCLEYCARILTNIVSIADEEVRMSAYPFLTCALALVVCGTKNPAELKDVMVKHLNHVLNTVGLKYIYTTLSDCIHAAACIIPVSEEQ